MKNALNTLILAMAIALPTLAQDRPAITAQPNTVFVGGDGKYETAPDTAVLQFSISARESTSRDAYDKVAKSAEQVRQVLRSNGIDPKTAEIGFYSVQPVYDYRDSRQKLTGYRVTTNVTLKFKDFTKLAPVLQQFSETGITENQNLSYTLEETDAAKSKAVEDAYRRAREAAAALARAAGRTLGELSYAAVDVSEGPAYPVVPMMRTVAMAKAGGAPSPTEEFSPQKVTLTAHVSALFQLK
jgi:uncharacterized protein YggE